MSPPADFEEEAARKNYKAPYSHNHPIPTIQRYREHRQELEERTEQAEEAQRTEEDDSRAKRAFSSVKKIVKNEDKEDPAGSPYPTANRHTQASDQPPSEHDSSLPQVRSDDKEDRNGDDSKHGKPELSATEKVAGSSDPKEKRKLMKHNKRTDGGREVTDPVTHLPLIIRDSTNKDLRRAPENEPALGMRGKTGTGLSTDSKSSSQLAYDQAQLQDGFDGMQKMFPPPSFEDTKAELVRTYQLALVVGLGTITVLAVSVVLFILTLSFRTQSTPTSKSWWNSLDTKPHVSSPFFPLAFAIISAAILGFLVIYQIQGWLGKKVQSIWDDEVWDAARGQEIKSNNEPGRLPESVAWMNSFLASVWPLINPDLFTSVIDMLEDVMQASLPKVIRMVSVDDLGQGSEAVRILGIRWLPLGAADKSVDEDGNIKQSGSKKMNDRGAAGEGEQDSDLSSDNKNSTPKSKGEDERQRKQEQRTDDSTREGMEAEEGDFVNMEIAFAYRARSSGKSLKSKSKNAHLYLKFYLPGGIFVPVWVELRGIIGTMRVRLQLTPDPPFVSLTTITFLGQPRADISCVPLSKHLPNLMNVPLISSFVQTSIDAALAEYVAPKSLTIDLKDMLVGDDFKKDTVTRGLVVVFIKGAQGFKEGDGGFGPIKASDAYVTCSWGKFGKTISSTRIIEKDQNPQWHEWAYMLVSSEELNAEEKLQLRIWDSDMFTADDDLGRVEVDLKQLMTNSRTKNRLCEREDRLRAQDPDERMPGTISWSVGYFEKLRITDAQLKSQTEDKNIRTKEDLRRTVSETAERKLREATEHDESKETNQQKAQDYQDRETALICSAPPDCDYPCGILSIQIHNITGLEVEELQKKDNDAAGDKEDEAEQSDDLPSSYCTIILNHKKIYMTRTKPKNAKPFFNAGTERYVRDWKTCEVMISCRDSRESENDALLGIVYLPLRKIFHSRSQVMDTYPLVGGIGYGRVRISLVFRSLDMKLPVRLIGWDYGTLEIKSPIKAKGSLPENLTDHRIKLRSNLGQIKMSSSDNSWILKGEKGSGFLPVRRRYSMPLIIEFRKSSFGSKTTPAFAVFWLKDIPDEEEQCITLQVWKGGKESLKRATTCAGYEGLDDGEKPLGEIEIIMRFWRGLSGYHKNFAHSGKGKDMRNVMEVLDTINDEIQDVDDAYGNFQSSDSETDDEDGASSGHAQAISKNPKLKPHTNDSDTSSDSDSDEGGSRNPVKKAKAVLNGHNDSDDGSRGLRGQVKDYKDHRKQLHRKHRGIMQWTVMRKADWAVDKVRHGKARLSGVFEHGDKEGSQVETEV